MEEVAILLISADPFSPFLTDLRMSVVASFVFVSALAFHEILAPLWILRFLRCSTRGLAGCRSWSGGLEAMG